MIWPFPQRFLGHFSLNVLYGLGPGADEGAQTGVGEVEAVGAAFEVERVEAGGVAVGHAGKSGCDEFTLDFLRAEEEAEGFSGGGYADGEELEDNAAAAGEGVRIERVVEA